MSTAIDSTFHVAYLTEELARRRIKNPGYSLRAFAKQLNIHPSALSRILQGKQELTTRAAIIALSSLEIEEPIRRKFMLSVAEEKKQRSLAAFEAAFSIALRNAAS